MLTVTQTFAGITAGAGATVAVIFVQAAHRARSLADLFANKDAKEAATAVLTPCARAVGHDGLNVHVNVVAAAIFAGAVLVAYYLKPHPPPQVTLPPTSTPLSHVDPLSHTIPAPPTTIPSPKLPSRGSPLPSRGSYLLFTYPYCLPTCTTLGRGGNQPTKRETRRGETVGGATYV